VRREQDVNLAYVKTIIDCVFEWTHLDFTYQFFLQVTQHTRTFTLSEVSHLMPSRCWSAGFISHHMSGKLQTVHLR